MSDDSFELKVVDVVEETADAHSISFEVPAGAEEQFAYKPGQFLTLAVPSDQTGVAARCYSLSSSPVGGGPLTITVKRTAEGYASNWVCDHLREGDTMRVLPPSGIFTPGVAERRPAALRGRQRHHAGHLDHPHRARAGHRPDRALLRQPRREVGDLRARAHRARRRAPRPAAWSCTGWSRCRGCRARTRCGRSRGVPVVRRLRLRPGAVHEDDGRRAEGAGVPARAPAPGEVHLPGRQPVRRPARQGGRRARDRGRRDRPRRRDRGGADDPGPQGPVKLEVELDGENYTFDDWAPGTKLLDHLEAKGIKAPYSCREGECSACAIRLLEGEVKMLHNDVLDDEDLAEGIRLGCQSVPVTDTVKVTYH